MPNRIERNQFTFYHSFWEAMKLLPKKDRLSFVEAICSYAFGEEMKAPTGAAAASFLLVKPILDKASKKSANGKHGGSKPKANSKQTESYIEVEREVEVEVEVEGDIPPTPHNSAVADVMTAYLDKVNPQLSERGRDELVGFVQVMGAEVCLRAIDEALDAKKATWPYIKAILQSKQAQGVRCLADWDALEKKNGRKQEKNQQPWSYDPGSMEGSL